MLSKTKRSDINFLSKVVTNILSQSMACVFIFLIVSFEEQTFKILVNLFCLFFLFCAFSFLFKKSYAKIFF